MRVWFVTAMVLGISVMPLSVLASELVDQPASQAAALPSSELVLERITTAVPWPRGLVFADGKLVALARGRHRRAGGPDALVDDKAGTLFTIDRDVFEPVIQGVEAGELVRRNARVLAGPTDEPFMLWDKTAVPAHSDTRTDRPYCTLAWDAVSRNFFICGFSGVDMADGTFRKNGSDSIHRLDTRTGVWSLVEAHRASLIPDAELGPWVANDTYPHPDDSSLPRGWLNGPDGAEVIGRWLYAAGKDNSVLVRYDLSAVRDDPEAGPPASELVLGDEVLVRDGDGTRMISVKGHSALVADPAGDYLYLGFRTSSQVVRLALTEDGSLAEPVVGDLLALFDPYDPEAGVSADLMDMAFNSDDELFVVTAASGRIWNLGAPDGTTLFDGRAGTTEQPYADLRALTGNNRTRCGNIAFDDLDGLYVCSGNYDDGAYSEAPKTAGVIYRVRYR
jgi:hypothetical protein